MFRHLLIALVLVVLTSPAIAAGARAWAELSATENPPGPLAANWDKLPDQQRERLLVVAKDFPKLSPDRQKLLHSRLKAWTRMTAEERQIARDNYKKIQALPKQDQDSIRQQWLDSLCREFGNSDKTDR